MKFVLYPVYVGIIFFSALLSLSCIYFSFKKIISACNWPIDFIELTAGVIVFFIGLFLIPVVISSYMSLKEIDKEKDRQFVASMFSNMVSLVAFVVALIALIKE